MSAYQTENFEANRSQVILDLKHAWDNNLPLVWLDEIVYSKTAMLKRTWSSSGVHFSTDQLDYYTDYRCAIVAVNSSMGVVTY